jgi:hypothetical protein
MRRGAGAGAAIGRAPRAARAGAGRAQRLRRCDRRLYAGPGLAPRLGPGACQPRLGVPVRQCPRAGVPGLRRGGPARPDGYGGRGAARVRLRQHHAAASDVEESLRRGEPTPRRLYNAARTYAQAASVAAAEVGRRGRAATRDALAYEARASTLLGQALERTPADRRAAFWREVVAPDDALSALRKWTRFAELARMAAAPSH